ncbi:MAG: glycosyltransferase [Halobacteriaceae archaeon]
MVDTDVAAFTDTYLPTVNGVTYTIQTWRDRWVDRGGRMAVVYPDADHDPISDEHPVSSLPLPFYEGFHLGTPRVPDAVRDVDLVHAHTPFAVGFAGLRLAGRADLPLVASYHTPTAEYADYLAVGDRSASALRGVSERYERWFYDRADLAVAPSEATRDHLREEVGVSTPVEVVPNGVDVEQFSPTDPADFLDRHGLHTDRPLVGYTGRHGYEKRLSDVIGAAAELDVTLVFGGDGPAREDIEEQAAAANVDARFLGFLDREEMAAFYTALDVFAFPSPVETQGLVALEANACGTPVVGADEGALATTVEDGVTGYHFETGDVVSFREALQRALAERESLRESCLARRDEMSVEHAVDRLEELYASVR